MNLPPSPSTLCPGMGFQGVRSRCRHMIPDVSVPESPFVFAHFKLAIGEEMVWCLFVRPKLRPPEDVSP